MKGIKSFYTGPFLIAVIIFCSVLLGQKVVEFGKNQSGQGTSVEDTDFGSFLAAQHAIYVNDFENASRMIADVKADNKNIASIKNLTEFFSGKCRQMQRLLKIPRILLNV